MEHLCTIGFAGKTAEQFFGLLRNAGVKQLIDIRQNRAARVERFLNSQFQYKIMSCPHHFVRIGLTRPYREFCWLMLDTLFPMPQADWLEEL